MLATFCGLALWDVAKRRRKRKGVVLVLVGKIASETTIEDAHSEIGELFAGDIALQAVGPLHPHATQIQDSSVSMKSPMQ